jgi:hypothetical protein
VLYVTKDLKAKSMSDNHIWTFSSDCHVSTLDREFTVVSVIDFHALGVDLGHSLDTAVRVDLNQIMQQSRSVEESESTWLFIAFKIAY